MTAAASLVDVPATHTAQQNDSGLTSWGWYLPRYRLDRRELGRALHVAAGSGTRTVASFDEDATTMGVEAARRALGQMPEGTNPPGSLWFATTRPPYLDKTNATAIAAACGLPNSVATFDAGGAIRSGMGVLRAAANDRSGGVAVLSDLRMGRPGSSDESRGGDGAAAFTFGPDPLAHVVASASVSVELLDRWRLEGDTGVQGWDERWSADQYLPLVERVVSDVLKASGLTLADIDHAVVSCPHSRVTRQLLGTLGPETQHFDPTPTLGYLGVADAGIQLAYALDRALPNQHILVVSGSDGADAMILRTTDRMPTRSGQAPEAPDAGLLIDAVTYLTWRGILDREPPRRPDPETPASPASARNEHWKFAFVGSRCTVCSTRHLPPQRVCMQCGSIDQMVDDPVSADHAVVANFTIDYLAYSASPPAVVGVLDFDGGGRYRCQLTDVVADDVRIGSRVEMVFRVISDSPNGVRNYFWKARPILKEESS